MTPCLLALLLLVATVPTAASDGTEAASRAKALERARYYEDNAGYHTLAFRELADIIERAQGNFDALLECVEAVYATGSNTPIIVALASAVAQEEAPVPHFEDLLYVARKHRSESVQVQRYLEAVVQGNMSYDQFKAVTEPRM